MGRVANLLEVWLPPAARWSGKGEWPARWLARGEAIAAGPADVEAAIDEAFPRSDGSALPVAALLRRHLADDAGEHLWLGADPAWIQPDMNGARLLACQQLSLELGEAKALGRLLQPLFAEQGIELHIDDPRYWQLKLPPGFECPDMVAPSQAMGADVLAFLPAGPQGRRWRILFNDVQTVLHAAGLNPGRVARGLPPVNSLWFWGGGRLPARLGCRWQGVVSDDPVLLAAAAGAGAAVRPFGPEALAALEGHWMVDLQRVEDTHWEAWMHALAGRAARTPLQWRLADGRRWLHRPWHRLRGWRSTWTG